MFATTDTPPAAPQTETGFSATYVWQISSVAAMGGRRARRAVPLAGYAAICCVGFVGIRTRLPETKGKALEQIERELGD